VGILEIAREAQRRDRTGDDKYVGGRGGKRFVYFFELRVPEGATEAPVPGGYLYPLVLPPTSLRMSEPFAVEKSFTLDGGLFVEENGILARELTISATTGFRPRKNKQQSDFDLILPSEQKSFTRTIKRGQDALIEALSGQKHFQYLQDSVFRIYADLKRDPATSLGTELYFHNTKDDEHWRVVPLNFDLNRDGASPLTYPHEFKLLCVEGAADVSQAPSEDATVLDAIKDAFAMSKFGVSLLEAGIADLSEIQNDLTTVLNNGPSLIDTVADVADATTRFLEGTERLVRVPANTLTRTNIALGAGLAAIDQDATVLNLAASGGGVPAALVNTLRKLQDGLYVINSYPEQFQNSIEAIVEDFNRLQSLSLSKSAEELEAAEAAGPPQTVRGFGTLGTALLPGDRRRARDDLGLGRAVRRYTSAVERVIGQGDTIANLAARYLGNAREWKILAIFNGLQPPYISTQGLPFTLDVGDNILVPNFGKSQRRRASPATLGVSPDAPAEEHFLGTDLLLEDTAPNGLADFVIDTEGGSVDLRRVVGRLNLQQGIRTRIRTERGSDILYRNLGMRRVVGVGVSIVDLEQAQFSVVETVQADPRIANVRRIQFENTAEAPDVLEVDLEAVVRGFTRPVKIRTPVA